jgi:putative ATPase
MRPKNLDKFVGQEKLIGKGKPLRIAIENDQLQSLIFWGPPGSGKTTLAMIIARMTKSFFVPFSAVTSGIPDLIEIIKEEKQRWTFHQQRTILFVDEMPSIPELLTLRIKRRVRIRIRRRIKKRRKRLK